MKFKVFEVNSNGKIEFTKEELEKILEEVYNEGAKENQKNNPIYRQGGCIPYHEIKTEINGDMNIDSFARKLEKQIDKQWKGNNIK